MQHRGEIVERAVRQSGMPLTALSKKLGKSRRWMYNAFENPQLSIDYILEIGKIIHHDFTGEISEISSTISIAKAPDLTYTLPEESVGYWKSKYYNLLEEYTALLKEMKGI